MLQVSPEACQVIAEQEIFRRSNAWKPTRCDKTVREFWSSHFWSLPEDTSWIWNRHDEKNHLPVGGAQPKHLLRAFILLKIYAPRNPVNFNI
jgi:hypothetical protein